MNSNLSRRDLVANASGFALALFFGFECREAKASLSLAEREWRYCGSCGVLFHSGSGRGMCPNNAGGHSAAGFMFVIDYHPGQCGPDTEKTQARWRKCEKCFTMYYNGEGSPKLCSSGGRHSRAQQRCYDLSTNRLHGPVLNPEGPHRQGAWRYCGRCGSLFFDGFVDNKGVCPAGGAHAALGDTFVLSH